MNILVLVSNFRIFAFQTTRNYSNENNIWIRSYGITMCKFEQRKNIDMWNNIYLSQFTHWRLYIWYLEAFPVVQIMKYLWGKKNRKIKFETCFFFFRQWNRTPCSSFLQQFYLYVRNLSIHLLQLTSGKGVFSKIIGSAL